MTTVTELLNDPESVGVWTLVPGRTRITFRNKTMWGALMVHGAFTEFSGDGQITNTGDVSGRVNIVAASLNTKLRKRDEDLRGRTFLDVENYPDIKVVVAAAEPNGTDTVDVRADLTVKGHTALIPLHANVEALDDGAVRISTKTTLNRKAWGVTGNMLGMVGDKTTLWAYLVFQRGAS